MLTPTAQQEEIIAKFKSRLSFKILAYAGTGKTSTLKMCAEAVPDARILYICFDAKTAERAKTSMPSNVDPRTFHSLAREHIVGQAVGYYGLEAEEHFINKAHKNGNVFLTRPLELAKFFDVTTPLKTTESEIKEGNDPNVVILSPVQQIRACEKAIKKFCYSADTTIRKSHFEVDYIVPDALSLLADKMWGETRLLYGRTAWSYDIYAKIWVLQNPDISYKYDAILVDEAQDSNPVQLGFYINQSVQTVYVGDSHQSIYQFRGVSDALRQVDLPKLALSESFRFGKNIAKAAGLVFEKATGTSVPIKGLGKVPGAVARDIIDPDSYLCRKNTTALHLLVTDFEGIKSSRPAFLAAKTKGKIGKTAKTLAWFVDNREKSNLKRPEWLDEELSRYEDIDEIHEAVLLGEEAPLVKDLLTIVEDYTKRAELFERIKRCGGKKPTRYPVLEIMTVHASKGGEWPRVQLADDFRKPVRFLEQKDSDGNPIVFYPPEEELNLIYVSITRAQEAVGLGDSEWILN